MLSFLSYNFFRKLPDLNLIFFYMIAVFDLIRLFFPKIYFSISKKEKKNQLISNFVFDICLDRNFPFRGGLFKKKRKKQKNKPVCPY